MCGADHAVDIELHLRKYVPSITGSDGIAHKNEHICGLMEEFEKAMENKGGGA